MRKNNVGVRWNISGLQRKIEETDKAIRAEIVVCGPQHPAGCIGLHELEYIKLLLSIALKRPSKQWEGDLFDIKLSEAVLNGVYTQFYLEQWIRRLGKQQRRFKWLDEQHHQLKRRQQFNALCKAIAS